MRRRYRGPTTHLPYYIVGWVQYFASSFVWRAHSIINSELTLASSGPKKPSARTGSSIFNGFGTECMGTVRTRCHESNFWGARCAVSINLPRRKAGSSQPHVVFVRFKTLNWRDQARLTDGVCKTKMGKCMWWISGGRACTQSLQIFWSHLHTFMCKNFYSCIAQLTIGKSQILK